MINRYHKNQLMAQIVHYGSLIETAGQVAQDLEQDIQGQTQQILAQIDSLLAEVGASKHHLTRIQMWMKDIGEFEQMNQVYAKWLDNCDQPVRACVESRLADPRYLIEIQAFAYLPD